WRRDSAYRSLRRTRLSAIRSVTRSLSNHSARGMVNLRLWPVSSLKPCASMEPCCCRCRTSLLRRSRSGAAPNQSSSLTLTARPRALALLLLRDARIERCGLGVLVEPGGELQLELAQQGRMHVEAGLAVEEDGAAELCEPLQGAIRRLESERSARGEPRRGAS